MTVSYMFFLFVCFSVQPCYVLCSWGGETTLVAMCFILGGDITVATMCFVVGKGRCKQFKVV